MEYRFHRTGAERKALVIAISEITGHSPTYMGAPTFAYAIGSYSVDKEGTLMIGKQAAESGEAKALLEALANRGIVSPKPLAFGLDRLSIAVPLDGFSDTALTNLKKLLDSKAALIQKSIGVGNLPFALSETQLSFPWFATNSSAEEVDAYTKFIHALCEMAKTQKRVTAVEKPVESEKYSMRVFLLRLGFIGPEYASARKILLANLSGSGSSRGKP